MQKISLSKKIGTTSLLVSGICFFVVLFCFAQTNEFFSENFIDTGSEDIEIENGNDKEISNTNEKKSETKILEDDLPKQKNDSDEENVEKREEKQLIENEVKEESKMSSSKSNALKEESLLLGSEKNHGINKTVLEEIVKKEIINEASTVFESNPKSMPEELKSEVIKNKEIIKAEPVSEIQKIVINEVVIGDETSSKNDFIELYNFSQKKIDLDRFSLKKKTKGGTKSNIVSSKKFFGKIGPGDFFVIKNKNYIGEIKSDLEFSGTSYSIAKDNRIYLYNGEEQLVDFVYWGDCLKDCEENLIKIDLNSSESLSRKIFLEKGSDDNFEITSFMTPGSKNIFSSKIQYSKKVYFNEVLANPIGEDKGNEFIEIINNDIVGIDFENWAFRNGAGKVFRIKNLYIEKNSFGVVRIENSRLVLRNSNEELFLLDPNGSIVDRVTIGGSSPSGVSFGKGVDGLWSWNRVVTMGESNKLNTLPSIKLKKSKKIYRDIYAEFDVSKSVDKDGDKLKFVWDFGDQHKSYLAKTKHLYKKKGSFFVTVRVSDGYGSVSKTFKVKVESFPRKKIEIIGITPNPKGRDRNHETIEIYNKSSKELNLIDFYIATGRKYSSLVRHRIRKKFKISAGKSRIISNDKICSFSLLNTNGKIVLLYPDGKSAFKLGYDKDKIRDDESYKRIEGVWSWFGGKKNEKIYEVSKMDTSDNKRIEAEEKNLIVLMRNTFYNDVQKMCETFLKVKIENWKNLENDSQKVLFKKYLKRDSFKISFKKSE